MNQEVQVFKDQYLEGNTITITSNPIPARGNKCVVSVTVLNASSSATTTVNLEGSYDGKAWERPTTAVTVAISDFGNGNAASAAGEFDYSYVRLAATTGASDKTIFDASVAFSAQ